VTLFGNYSVIGRSFVVSILKIHVTTCVHPVHSGESKVSSVSVAVVLILIRMVKFLESYGAACPTLKNRSESALTNVLFILDVYYTRYAEIVLAIKLADSRLSEDGQLCIYIYHVFLCLRVGS